MKFIRQYFNFPNDIIKFGKYQGFEIKDIIFSDMKYINYLLSECIGVSSLVTDYINGKDNFKTKIDTVINKDKLLVIKIKYYSLPPIKFIRKKELTKHISTERLGVFKIDLPFTVTNEVNIKSVLGKGLQNSDINLDIEKSTIKYVYDENDLKLFISNILNNYQL